MEKSPIMKLVVGLEIFHRRMGMPAICCTGIMGLLTRTNYRAKQFSETDTALQLCRRGRVFLDTDP